MKLFRKKPKREEEKPLFRFYPGAYDEGGPLIVSEDRCDCCGNPCVWKYAGNIYAREKFAVCAGCIGSGAIQSLFAKDGYSLHDIEFEFEVPRELADEVLERTPGVACFNPFVWPIHNGKPMVFIGYGDSPKLAKNAAAIEATENAFRALGAEGVSGPSPYALIFQELGGEVLRAVIDMD